MNQEAYKNIYSKQNSNTHQRNILEFWLTA